MVQVLDPELCNSIRLILGEEPATLPDESLMDPLLGGAAEARVLALIGPPAFDLRPPGERDRIRSAVGYMTASMLVSGRRREFSRTSEQFSSQYRYTTSQINVEAWIDQLERQALDGLSDLIAQPDTGGSVHFGLAHGGRGR